MFILIAAFDYSFLAQKVQIARSYLEQGKPSEAYKVAKDLLKYPQYPKYYLLGRFYKAKSLLDMGYFSRAAREFQKFETGVRKSRVKSLYPYLDEAIYYRAYSLQRARDLEGALSLYKRLMRLYPQSFLYQGAKYRIAQIYEEKGLKNEAIKIYQELSQEDSGSYSNLARRRLQKIEEERKHKEEISKIKQKSEQEKKKLKEKAQREIQRRDELIVKLMDQNQNRLIESYKKENKIEQLKTRVGKLNEKIAELNHKIDKLKEQIEKKDREIEKLHSEIDKLQKELEEGKLKKEELEKKEAELLKKLANLEKEKSELEKEKRALEEEKKALLQAKAEEGDF